MLPSINLDDLDICPCLPAYYHLCRLLLELKAMQSLKTYRFLLIFMSALPAAVRHLYVAAMPMKGKILMKIPF